jgi:hypothetical protein
MHRTRSLPGRPKPPRLDRLLFRRRTLVAMAVFVEIARLMAGVIVMLARNFLHRLVAVPVRVEIARGVTRMIVMLTGLLFFSHGFLFGC